MFERTETSWLEEELERERKGIRVDETWWEKLCRLVSDAYEIVAGTLTRKIDAVIMKQTYKKVEFQLSSGMLTANQARALYDLPPVECMDDLILYTDNQPVEVVRR